MRNIDQQVLLLERLNDGREDDGDDLERCGRDRCLGHEDTGVEFVLADVLGEGAHLFDADTGVGGEFNPDRADLRLRIGIGLGGQRGVLCEHGVCGPEGGGHLLAAV